MPSQPTEPMHQGGPRRPRKPKLRLSAREWRVHLAWLNATIPWVAETQERFRRSWKRTQLQSFWESYRYFGNVHAFLKGELYRTCKRLGLPYGKEANADKPISEVAA
jgi:hypothetical protein